MDAEPEVPLTMLRRILAAEMAVLRAAAIFAGRTKRQAELAAVLIAHAPLVQRLRRDIWLAEQCAAQQSRAGQEKPL